MKLGKVNVKHKPSTFKSVSYGTKIEQKKSIDRQVKPSCLYEQILVK